MKRVVKVFLTLLIVCGFAYSQQDMGKVKIDKSGYLNVGDDKIFYEIAGKGPVIVFLHDGTVHSEIWDAQFSFFSQNHKVIRYDRRGYGKSSPATGKYSNVEDLKGLFDLLNIDNACLIGMSAGGRISIDFTLKYPEKVNSLILVGAVVNGFSFTEHFDSRGGRLPSDISDMEQLRAFIASEDPYTIYVENKAARERVKQLTLNYPFRNKDSISMDNIPSNKPSYLRLNEIDVPTLILAGEYDIPDVHAHAGAINAGIKNSIRDIILKSAHLIPIEQPDIFNKKVLLFLNSLLVEECKKK